MNYLFTSESVTEGHPDKICDRIADTILDTCLASDSSSHVACEVTATVDKVHIMGEITSAAHPDYEGIARNAIKQIGYCDAGHGFDYKTCDVEEDVHEQSPDIAMGVCKKNPLENGAGDQGMMFGFACKESAYYMPLAFELANNLTRRLEYVRKMFIIPELLPDGKAQVTVEYKNNKPFRIDTVVLSSQHTENIPLAELRMKLMDQVICAALPVEMLDNSTKYYINPTGRFVVGGPAGDTGLTGRKIIADTYGGYARHGGGSFSGKDPSKVDRSGAYMARFIAKNIVACGMAEKCEVQLSYAIGIAEPVSIYVDAFNTNKCPVEEIVSAIKSKEDLTPTGIIDKFGLNAPIYAPLSCHGHFGMNAAEMPWEKIEW